ncbi:uncharacterized protein LOC143623441 [Bidens hawaiensis]|uniref:uncharacterized protein LOC143623441 n=1 Tax=Bidens hawaiensis TaxID=980011 RepID=UPI00404AEB9A
MTVKDQGDSKKSTNTFDLRLLYVLITILIVMQFRKDMMLELKSERVKNEILLGEIKTGKGLNQEVSLARAGDTRWGSYHRTITSLLKLFPEVVEVLQFIKLDGDSVQQKSNAKGLTNVLSKHLQKKSQSQDLLEAFKLISETNRALNNLRQTGFDKMLAKEDANFAKLGGMGDLARAMVETGKHTTYPLVYLILKLALVLPVATAIVERCFSKMKFIRTDFRTRMGKKN